MRLMFDINFDLSWLALNVAIVGLSVLTIAENIKNINHTMREPEDVNLSDTDESSNSDSGKDEVDTKST